MSDKRVFQVPIEKLKYGPGSPQYGFIGARQGWTDDKRVLELAELVLMGKALPPIRIDTNFCIIDGLHRVKAHIKCGESAIAAVMEGSNRVCAYPGCNTKVSKNHFVYCSDHIFVHVHCPNCGNHYTPNRMKWDKCPDPLAHCWRCTRRFRSLCRVCGSEFKAIKPSQVACDECKPINSKLTQLISAANARPGVNQPLVVDDLVKLYTQNKVCSLCAAHIDLQDLSLDHRVPLSSGGTNTIDNIDFMHVWCNLFKSSMSIEDAVEKFSRMYLVARKESTCQTQNT